MSKAKSDNRTVKKRNKIIVPVGVAHVSATFNNIIVTITDPRGNTVAWSSAGFHGFKGSRKSTPYAAQITAEHVGKLALDCGMKTMSIEVKGPGAGRESALRALMSLGFVVSLIKDVTPIAHNGCRPPKRRRV